MLAREDTVPQSRNQIAEVIYRACDNRRLTAPAGSDVAGNRQRIARQLTPGIGG